MPMKSDLARDQPGKARGNCCRQADDRLTSRQAQKNEVEKTGERETLRPMDGIPPLLRKRDRPRMQGYDSDVRLRAA